MSATGRGSKRSLRDFYPTPRWAVRRLLDRVSLPGGEWLEPCCGDGSVIKAVNDYRDDVRWSACDIAQNPYSDPEDFLTRKPGRYDVTLTNPPFSLAMEFVEKALRESEVVAMLLRLNWLGSAKRQRFLSLNTPSVAVLPNRPSFSGGGTDACEYGWMIWGLYAVPRLVVLDVTPKEERLDEVRRQTVSIQCGVERTEEPGI